MKKLVSYSGYRSHVFLVRQGAGVNGWRVGGTARVGRTASRIEKFAPRHKRIGAVAETADAPQKLGAPRSPLPNQVICCRTRRLTRCICQRGRRIPTESRV